MQEAQKRDSEAAELAAKMEKEKKEMQVSTTIFSETILIKSEWRIINPLEKLEVGNYISVGYSI